MDELKYKMLKGTLWTISLLPFDVLYALSDICCVFVSRLYRRKTVRQNLSSAFPEKSKDELRRIESGFYHQLCDNFVEVIKAMSMSKEEMMRRMTFSGIEEAKKRHEAGQQFHFLYLSHFGNWEWVASISYHIQPWCKPSQIYHHIYNKEMNRLFLELRSRYGGESIEMKETFRRILQMKRENNNHIVGFISDQQPKWKSIHHFVPFLNHETAVFTGAEHIARKIDAFTMYGRMSRPRRGYYHLEIVPMEDHPGSLPENVLTERYFQLLEEDILRNPEMWLWTHKRWSRTKEEWERRQKTAL